MAKVIIGDNELQLIGSYYPIIKIILIGLSSGLLFCFLTWTIQSYAIEPLFCGSSSHLMTCLNSVSISGNIAMILVALIGVITMVRFRLAQPLIVSMAVVASLWGLANWTSGLMIFEMIAWSSLLFILAYVLFTWLTRNNRIWLTAAIMIIVVVLVRIAISL